MMTILYILAGLVALLLAWRVGLVIITKSADVYHHLKFMQWERAELDLQKAERERLLREPTQINPDHATGSYPLLRDPVSKRVLDADRGLLFDGEGLRAWSPVVHDWAARRRVVQSLHVNVGGGDPVGGLLQAPQPEAQWPAEVPLKTVCSEPDIKTLALGVTIGDNGRQETVKADLSKLVHIAIGGSSGWGKSVFLRSLGYQLALSQTPVDLAMIDLEGQTLAPFARCGRLLYPVADTEAEALAILKALLDEMERRKGLYATFPGVDSLEAYNARASEPLVALVAIIDEATALLGDKSVESVLRTLALRARKYGLWLVMAGQDWKASSLDTAIRNQLSSRVQFRAMSKSQSRVLLEQSGAETLPVEGRALAILPGKPLFTMQAPFISTRTITADVSDGGPRYPMPEGGNGGNGNQEQRIRELAEQGYSKRQIALEVFGYAGGSAYQSVTDVLESSLKERLTSRLKLRE